MTIKTPFLKPHFPSTSRLSIWSLQEETLWSPILQRSFPLTAQPPLCPVSSILLSVRHVCLIQQVDR